MKRWTFLILLCLLLGIVTTVGVSWCILWTWNPESALVTMTVGYSTEDRSGWLVTLDDKSFGRISIGMRPASENDTGKYEVISDILPTWSTALRPVPIERKLTIYEYAGGWPYLALCYKLTVDAEQPKPEWIMSGGFPTGASPFLAADEFEDFRALPYIPIFPGFLIDTLLYGFIWFGLFVSIYASRKAIRRKRGRCIKCGYDLRGQKMKNPHPQPLSLGERRVGGCPECGWNRLETSKN